MLEMQDAQINIKEDNKKNKSTHKMGIKGEHELLFRSPRTEKNLYENVENLILRKKLK